MTFPHHTIDLVLGLILRQLVKSDWSKSQINENQRKNDGFSSHTYIICISMKNVERRLRLNIKASAFSDAYARTHAYCDKSSLN